jgi:cell division protein FtsL
MSIFSRKVRGFRVIEIVATAFLLFLVLAVYLAKAGAGRERAQIAQVEASIDDEQRQMRLLRAEVAHLEQPERIERLSTVYLGLAPIDPKHEAPPEALPEIAQGGAPGDAKALTP